MYIEYNPNPKGKSVGDCVIRAISKAMDISWDDAYMRLFTQGYILKDIATANDVWGRFLIDNGYKRREEAETMPSPIFNAMNVRGPQPRSMDIIQQYNQSKQDPFMFMLQNRGINVPQEYRNNPQGAVNYLLQSEQMSQDQLDYIKSMAQRMGLQI